MAASPEGLRVTGTAPPAQPKVLAVSISWVYVSVLVVTVAVFLSEWVAGVGVVPIPTGSRHSAVLGLFAFNWLLSGARLAVGRGYRNGLLLLGVYLLVAYLLVPVAPLNFALGSIFSFLFIAVFLLGYGTHPSSRSVLQLFKGVLVFFALMSIPQIVQGLMTGVSLRDVPGFFRELGAFGAAMNIGVTLCLSLFIMGRRPVYLYIAVFFTFAVLLTILKKSIVENLMIWFAFSAIYATARLRLKLIVVAIVIGALGLFLVGSELLANLVLNADYLRAVGLAGHVRIGMFIASFRIATDYFPFGSGMGTFGSLASIVGGYSKLYVEYGVSAMETNSPEAIARGATTLFDTFWPHIVGELGFLGTLIFLYLWFYPAKASFAVVRVCQDPIIKGLSFYVLVVILMMTAEGFSLFTPEIPSFILLHSGIGGMAYYHVAQYRRSHPDQFQRRRGRLPVPTS